MSMTRACVAAAVLGIAGLRAGAEEKEAPPDPALVKAVEAVEKASREILALQADYTRNYSVYGRAGFITEKGRFAWRRTPEGKVAERWDGADEKGPVLTLVRDNQASIWRGGKKESTIPLDDPKFFHVARFNFPLVPRDWQSAFVLGGPRTSPEFDDRFPEKTAKGIPSCLTFSPRRQDQRMSFKMISLLFDEETGLAYRFRCDTYGWTMAIVDLGDWTVNPKLPESLFEPPSPGGTPPAGDAPKPGGDAPAKARDGARP
jgi:hypothetical protein